MIAAYFKAQHINKHSGGMVIAPWEIEPGYPLEEWVEAALKLSTVQSIRDRNEAQQRYMEKFRRGHKDYAHHYRN